MDVMVRNLPEQMTEKQVENYFRDVLEPFGIKTFYCQKFSRGCAKLTVADRFKGIRFLQTHGQTKPGANGFTHVHKKLYVLRRPVNCTLSTDNVDDHLVKALKQEESDRYAALQRKPNIVQGHAEAKPRDSPRAFDLSATKCGQWGYSDTKLAFCTYWSNGRPGRLVFGFRGVTIKLHPERDSLPAHQIELPYGSIDSLVVSGDTQSVTFSLQEGPKLYESLSSNSAPTLQSAFQNLAIQKASQKSFQSFKRTRLRALDSSHEKIVGSCLCYRLILSKPSDIALVKQLKKYPEVPMIADLNTRSISKPPFHLQMWNLNRALASSPYVAIPFEVKFQLQKLAQGGYLSPARVLELLPLVADYLTRDTALTVAGALRSVASQLPYAGPDAEFIDFKIKSFCRVLEQSIQVIKESDPYATSLAQQYDHMMLVHKATVTPTRILLSGPEPEMKNRVLRKYSASPNHFLSVSFQDENGEQIRFDRQTDNSKIYHERFKSVLNGVIHIADWGFQV